MTEADAWKALPARANKLAGEDELSGAALVGKDDRVLFSHAYALADHSRLYRRVHQRLLTNRTAPP